MFCTFTYVVFILYNEINAWTKASTLSHSFEKPIALRLYSDCKMINKKKYVPYIAFSSINYCALFQANAATTSLKKQDILKKDISM